MRRGQVKFLPKSSYFKNKRVIIRADLNVDIVDNKIADDYRIARALPTIKFIAPHARYTIIISHRGSFEKSNDPSESLKLIARRLGSLLKRDVYFLEGSLRSVELALATVPAHAIIVLENIRWQQGERENSIVLAKQLAGLADVFVNDAFGESHRRVASLSAITRFLPSFGGLLLKDELKHLDALGGKIKTPFVVVLGGAKLTTKLPLMRLLLKRADYVLIGTALANTFLAAKGIAIGRSFKDAGFVPQARQLLKNKKLVIPDDYLVARATYRGKGRVLSGNVAKQDMIVDIGPKTIGRFIKILSSARTIFWNGPVGCFEHKPFSRGSLAVLSAILKNTQAVKIIGGGDTLELLGKKKQITRKNLFISTGGGAMLTYLSGEKLPGIESLKS